MVKVSVWITTYNHEKFIAKALDSVLMQETKFEYEIIIGEDCSTDNTRQVVIKYKDNHPDKIRLFLPKHNLGMIAMAKATYELCTGEYIAWLDGDDFWTNPSKLQMQVDFLEENPDYVLIFHNKKELNQIDGTFNVFDGPIRNDDDSLSMIHFLNEVNPIYSGSVLHRNILGEKLPEWIYSLPYLDLVIYYLLLPNGKFKYIDEVMGVYRVHKGGDWSGKTLYQQLSATVLFYQILLKNLDYLKKNKGYYKKLKSRISVLSFDLLEIALRERDFEDSKLKFLTILKNDHWTFYYRKFDLFKLLKDTSRDFLKITTFFL